MAKKLEEFYKQNKQEMLKLRLKGEVMMASFKFYFGMIFFLIGAQIVVAGENVVSFQQALEVYQQQRHPSQTEVQESQTHLVNPAIEIDVVDSKSKPRRPTSGDKKKR